MNDPMLEPLDRLRVPDVSGEVARRLQNPSAPIPSSSRPSRRIAAAVVAFAVFGAAAGFAWTMFSGGEETIPVTDPWSWAGEGWTELPPPPEFRDGAAVVWTGTEVMYWGGLTRDGSELLRDDGWIFDPAARDWRSIPPAPVALSRSHGVWTGGEVIVWGEPEALVEDQVPTSDFGAVLAFDPATVTWRELPPSPHLPSYGGTWEWTGTELVVFGGGDRPDDPSAVAGAALDPVDGSWRPLPEAPLPMTLANATRVGDEVVFVGAAMRSGGHSTTPTAIALAYAPLTDTWRILPEPPLSPQSSDIIEAGGRVVGWDYGGDSAEWLPTEGRWRSLGRQPLDHGECYVSGAAAGETVFAWNCGYVDAWYPGAGWRNVEGGPAASVPVTMTVMGSSGWTEPAGSVAIIGNVENIVRGDQVVSIGDPDAPAHLWVWRPPSEPPSAVPMAPADVEWAVNGFLGAWGPGYDPYLATYATSEVIEALRAGSGGVPSMEGGTYRAWNIWEPREEEPGIYEVRVVLYEDDAVASRFLFRVGPGTAADGRHGPLVILDVAAQT